MNAIGHVIGNTGDSERVQPSTDAPSPLSDGRRVIDALQVAMQRRSDLRQGPLTMNLRSFLQAGNPGTATTRSSWVPSTKFRSRFIQLNLKGRISWAEVFLRIG